jgi:hypothetical protein
MKNSNDTIRNRTRDLPACMAVPQPTAIKMQITIILSDNIYGVGERGESGTNYWTLAFRKGTRGPVYVAYVFVFLGSIIICRLYKLNPFARSPSPSAPESQPFRYSVKIFSQFAFGWGPEKIFSPGPKPALGSPYSVPV